MSGGRGCDKGGSRMRRCLVLASPFSLLPPLPPAPPPPHRDPIASLIRRLSAGPDPARAEAARDLGNLGAAAREAIPALVKALHDRDPEVRVRATKALG